MTNPPTQPLSYDSLVSLLHSIRDEVGRMKISTGELQSVREQITAIDRAMRGYNGGKGLVERVSLVEQSIDHLTKTQLPEILAEIRETLKSANSTGGNLQQCQLSHQSLMSTLKAELNILRAEYQTHVDAEKKESSQEEKENKRFGGREWWQENASSLLIAIVTALATAGAVYLATNVIK